MQRANASVIKIILSSILLVLIHACSSDIGGHEDRIKPVATLTSLNDGEEVVGNYTITWQTDEANPSTVDIYTSDDSGLSWTLLEINLPDANSFDWDSNSIDDCRSCRIRIIPKDVVGNIGEPADSIADFIVNNIPNLLNIALFYDTDDNGIDEGDTIIIQFDKDIEAFTSNANDLFTLPVLGDFIGLSPYIKPTIFFNQLEIVLNGTSPESAFHLHANGTFSTEKNNATSPSGLVLREDISGSLVATDTGKSAKPLSSVDIFPALTKQVPVTPLSQGLNKTQAIAMADFDNDGDVDMISVDFAESLTTTNGTNLWENNKSSTNPGEFSKSNVLNGINIDDDATSIAVGDIDNDGDLDVVLGLANKTANQVFRNKTIDPSGVGTDLAFEDAVKLNIPSGNHSTYSVVLADIDKDNDLDLITGNADHANLVWINNGSGFFSYDDSQTGHTLGSSTTRAINLVDIDNDDDLDIISGNAGTADQVWLNDSTGLFTNAGQSLGTDNTYAIASGDVDNDGDNDFISGIYDDNNKLWLNDGNGTFTEETSSLEQSTPAATRDLILIDIDSDNDLDLISANENQPNRVFFNDSKGYFQDTGQLMGSQPTYALATADIDNDGDLDLAEGIKDQANALWINPAATTTLLTIQQEDNSYKTKSIALGDIDGDGDLDLVEGNELEDNRVYFNDRSIFRDSFQTLTGANTTKVLLGDLDKDGDLDLVIATGSNSDNINRIFNNNGDGIFTENPQAWAGSNTKTAALGDVDGDGDLDLIAGNSGIYVSKLWLNNAGNFTDSGQTLSTANTRDMVIEDLDNDGDLDLVFATNGSNETWVNNVNNLASEKGFFTKITDSSKTPGSNVFAIAAGDINGDENIDLATNTSSTGRTALNNPHALPPGTDSYNTCSLLDELVFCADDQTRISGDAQSMALRDIDNDGDLDWIIAYAGANKVILNDGTGEAKGERAFNSPVREFDFGSGTDDTREIAIGDIDNDGDLDIIEGNFGSANKVHLNDL